MNLSNKQMKHLGRLVGNMFPGVDILGKLSKLSPEAQAEILKILDMDEKDTENSPATEEAHRSIVANALSTPVGIVSPDNTAITAFSGQAQPAQPIAPVDGYVLYKNIYLKYANGVEKNYKKVVGTVYDINGVNGINISSNNGEVKVSGVRSPADMAQAMFGTLSTRGHKPKNPLSSFGDLFAHVLFEPTVENTKPYKVKDGELYTAADEQHLEAMMEIENRYGYTWNELVWQLVNCPEAKLYTQIPVILANLTPGDTRVVDYATFFSTITANGLLKA